MKIKRSCSTCINQKDVLVPCDWLGQQDSLIVECPRYQMKPGMEDREQVIKMLQTVPHVSYTHDVYGVVANHLISGGVRVRKKGKWIREGNQNTCSECGWFYLSGKADYRGCPMCLAEMEILE